MEIYRQPCSASVTSQALRYRNQRDNIQRMAAQAGDTGNDKSRSFLVFTRADAGWALFVYVVLFACFRFDIRRNGVSFQHPLSNCKAALLAVPFAVAVAVLVKIRNQNPVGADYVTSLSLNGSESKKPPTSDDDTRS